MNAKFLAVVVLVLTLIIGFLLGLLSDRIIWPAPAHVRSDRPHPPPGRMLDRDFFTERMERLLQVTDLQRDTVTAILQSHAARFLDMHEQQAAHMKQLMDSLLSDLRGVLSEDQIQQFEEHLSERQFRRRKPRFGPGPGAAATPDTGS